MAAKKKATRAKTKARKTELMEDVSPMDMSSHEHTIDTTSVRKISTKAKVAILLTVGVLAVVLYLSKSLLIAATVNGEIISRPKVVSDLEKQFGKQSLDAMVTEVLIGQEAKKQNVDVSESELNDELKKIEDSVKQQGQDLDTLLAMQGMNRAELTRQIKMQKLVEKIFGSKIDPTDQEIDDYVKKNKDTFPKDAKPEDIKAQAKEKLRGDKLQTEFQTWLTDIKSKADIKYYVNY